MKIRRDFVTNSSSSSFVINKIHKDFNSISSIYTFVRQEYLEWNTIRDKVINFCNNDERFQIKKEHGHIYFTISDELINKGKRLWDYDIQDAFFAATGMSIFDSIYFDTKWADSCETYEQFLNYFKTFKKEAPFKILNILEDKIQEEDSDYDYVSKEDLLGWYFPCRSSEPEYGSEYCEWCYVRGTKSCELSKNFIGVDKYNKFAETYGQFYISSESGMMPDYVIDKIKEKCELYCGHMG